MSALFRETAAGNFIHIISKGKLLRYPEEQPSFIVPDTLLHPNPPETPTHPNHSDTSTLVDPEAQVVKSEENRAEKSLDHTIVGWYGDDDPDNPQNWSVGKKALVTSIICGLTFAVYVGSSLIVSGFGGIMKDFNVGEQEATVTLSLYVFAYGTGALFFSPLSEIPAFGRNIFYWAPMLTMVGLQAGAWRVKTFTGLVLLRGLTAFCGSPVLSTGAATLADMYTPIQLPVILSIWVLPAFCAPAVGPVFGNFAAQANGWRWTMLELLWIIGFITILLIFVLPETSHANILLRRAKRLRKLTGNRNLRSQSEVHAAHLSAGQVFTSAIIKPVEITLLDPSIAFANAYIAVVYAIYYMFFDAFPIVYGEIFKFSFGAQGVIYLTNAIGGTVGFLLYVVYQKTYMANYYKKVGWPVNEKRLEPAIISSLFAPIGLFIFAWTSRTSAHWVGSAIGAGIFIMSNFITLQCVFFYIIISYPQYAASLFAANDFVRAATASGLVHSGTPLFRKIGIDGGVSFLAGLTVLGVLGVTGIYHYGARLRAKSRFAVGDT